MTIVEKAAYLKGLTEGIGLEPESKEVKLWAALNDLLHDMVHEIEDLQSSNMDHAEALDEMSDELSYIEEIVCDLDLPEQFDDDDFSGYEGFEDYEDCSGDCSGCMGCGDEDEEVDYGENDLELPEKTAAEDFSAYDSYGDYEESVDIIYDATCPVCGEEISFGREILEEGSIKCPGCGELLEFDLDDDDDDYDLDLDEDEEEDD